MAIQRDYGSNVPTTTQLDPQIIHQADFNSNTFKDFLVLMTQAINNLSYALNLKDSGYYYTKEFVNGQLFFADPALSSATANQPINRQAFRMVVNFGALPNTGTTNVAHNIPGIDANFKFTRIYGAATDPAALIALPLPFSSPTLADNILLQVDNTNVVITTGSNRAAFTNTIVVIEYMRY